MAKKRRISLFPRFRLAILILIVCAQLQVVGVISHQDVCSRLTSVAQADAGDSWRDSGWKYRKEISVDHTLAEGESFADYPLLFSITDVDLKSIDNGGKVGKEDGTDILFTEGDGVTQLSHEVEEYDPSTGKLTVWVKIPTLSNIADTKVYIYYGNASAGDQQDANNVWTSQYEMVQHMDGNSSLGDSTANDNDGAKAGTTLPQEIQGKIGKAQSFDESGTIVINDDDSLDFGNGDWTISFWLDFGDSDGGDVVSKGKSGENSLRVQKTATDGIWSNITGNGIFNYPVYSWGDGTYLYTVDRYNQRVVKTRLSDMSFVGEIKTWTGGAGQFSDPIGVWGDSTRLYVANSNYHRIEVFNLGDLSYITQIGSGAGGSGDNDFYYADNTWGDGTYLYILDTYNNRIVKRRADDYSFVAKIGTQGIGNDQFYRPWGIWGDGTYLYIADSSNNRIVKRKCSDLSYVTKIGTLGTGNDQFSKPTGIWGDGTYIYVGDSYNNRIVKRLASTFAYVSQIGGTASGTGNNQFNYPNGIWGDGPYLYVNDSNNDRIVKRLASDLSYVSALGIGQGGNYMAPVGIYNDGTYLYLTDTLNSSVVKRRLSDHSVVSKIGSLGTGNDQFNYPNGIWGDGTYLYIGDSSNNRIVKRLASNLSYVAQIGTYGSGNDQFYGVRGIWGDGTYLYVVDSYNHRIFKRLASDLSYVSLIGGAPSGTGNDQFYYPSYIWGDGTYLYITDGNNNRIVKRRIDDMSFVSKIGSSGEGNDEFNNLCGITAASGYLYVVDNGNLRIMKRLASDLSYYDEFAGSTLEDLSSGVSDGYNYITITKKNVGGISTLSTYINGALDSDTAERTYSDTSNDKNLVMGHLLTGKIDELRIITGVASLNRIVTDYNNQSSPGTYLSVLAEEERMDHFSISGISSQLSGGSQTLTISAIGSSGNVYSLYGGDHSVTLSGANIDAAGTPVFVDKNGSRINFGSSGTLTFTNGLATAVITLYKAETASIGISDGTYLQGDSFGIQVLPLGSVFIPPQKPSVSLSNLTFGNMPEDIKEIAVSASFDFKDSSWEAYDRDKMNSVLSEKRTVYVKFRNAEGGVSDVITIFPGSVVLNEGDIVKTADSFDVYIIKYKGGKRFKRLILSPSVFSSYQHLRWENLKTVSQSQMDDYTTSSLAQVMGDPNLYELTPLGDTGKRRLVNLSEGHDPDSAYEINSVDRDSYLLVD